MGWCLVDLPCVASLWIYCLQVESGGVASWVWWLSPIGVWVHAAVPGISSGGVVVMLSRGGTWRKLGGVAHGVDPDVVW